MSATLYIHVFTEGELTKDDFRSFFDSNLGSKWCGLGPCNSRKDVFDKFADTPQVMIGDVSWLKAALFEAPSVYVPDPVSAVFDIIGEDWPVIDANLIKQISIAMNIPNQTLYRMGDTPEIIEFLSKHIGKRAFTISW